MNGHLIVSILPLHSRRQAQEEGSSDGRKEGGKGRKGSRCDVNRFVRVSACM